MIKKTEQLYQQLTAQRLIALLTPSSAAQCLEAYEALQDQDLILEIALRSEHAVGGIRAIVEAHPEALVMAGTVMTAAQVVAALDAGAAGIVSADYIPEVLDVCVDRDTLCIPGGLADAGKQLVHKAMRYGCTLDELKERYPYQWIYKLFPAFTGATSQIGLARAWRGPFKGLTVVYTGGISLERLPEAVAQDPGGVFCASALTRGLEDREAWQHEIALWKAALQPDAGAVPAAASGTAGATQPAKPSKEQPSAPHDRCATPRVVTFGELMARLAPPSGQRLRLTRQLDLSFGGAEANVAVSLARFGLPAAFVSAVPDNDIGANALSTLASHGVDTTHVVRRGGARIGIYYLEHGAGPRPSKVVYDRLSSAFSESTAADYDWEAIFDGATWFHWTGITPALGDGVAARLRAGLEAAKACGVTVSTDLNYRKTLWSREKAQAVMSELMPFVDVLIANEEDPGSVFGIEPSGTDVEKGQVHRQSYEEVAEKLIERFAFKKVAITLRESISASENRWSACLYDGKSFYLSPTYHVWIVDRVGAGDAFAAGLIHGIQVGKSDPEALHFGVSASCLKHSIAGDFNLVDLAEVERFVGGQTAGRVVR